MISSLKRGWSKSGISLNKWNVTWFINYLQRDLSFQQIFIRTSTLFRRLLQTYICLDIYPGPVGVAAIEMLLSQQVLLMTFFNTEIIEGIVSAILMTYNVYNYLLWSMPGERAMAIGFNHGVLGLAENPARGTGFWSQNAEGVARGVLTEKARPEGWVFSQAQHPMIKTYYSMSLHPNTAIIVFKLLAIVEWKRQRADISSGHCC